MTINIPETKNIAVDKIKSDGKNPNRMNKQKYEALKKNMKKYGFIVPVITNKELVIADGEHRLKAAMDIGMTEVPVMALDVKEVDRRMLRQILNKLRGEHDKVMDLEEYDYIYGEGMYEEFRELLPDMSEYEELMKKRSKEQDPDDFNMKKAIKQPKYKITVGDVYELGEHRLMCGDSTNKEHMALLMKVPGDKVILDMAHMVFTDPPYGVSYTGTNNPNGRDWGKMLNDNLRGNELTTFLRSVFWNLKEFTIKNPAVYCCYATINHMQFEMALIEADFRIKQVLVWNKGHILGHSDYHWTHEPIIYASKKEANCEWYGNRTHKTVIEKKAQELQTMKKEDLLNMLLDIKERSTLIDVRKDSPADYIHPTQKPVDLITIMLRNSSEIGHIVLEPFAGSGSTIIACEQTRRRCRAIELDPKYCSGIIERWENFTGLKAKKVKQ